MLNPYILLGLVIFWIASVTGAYLKGHSIAEDQAKAAYSKQLDAAIASHNEDALVDMQAAREAGEREARARVVTRTITNEVTKVIHEKPSPAICRWDDPSVGLLQRAVEAANDLAPAAKSVPDAGSPVKPAIKPGR